ncbi:hypothetical protein ACFQY7_41290 [Actinomadura luteofluorescens]
MRSSPDGLATLSTLAQAANVTTDQAVDLLDQLLRSGIIAVGEA